MSRPEDLKYTSTHEWVRIDGDGDGGNIVTVGITDYAVEQLSDLAFVDLPESGASVTRGASFGEIESTKTVAELMAPVSGEIVEVNTEIVENLELLSLTPFEAGWLVKIRAADPEEFSSLLGEEQYDAQIKSEEH